MPDQPGTQTALEALTAELTYLQGRVDALDLDRAVSRLDPVAARLEAVGLDHRAAMFREARGPRIVQHTYATRAELVARLDDEDWRPLAQAAIAQLDADPTAHLRELEAALKALGDRRDHAAKMIRSTLSRDIEREQREPSILWSVRLVTDADRLLGLSFLVGETLRDVKEFRFDAAGEGCAAAPAATAPDAAAEAPAAARPRPPSPAEFRVLSLFKQSVGYVQAAAIEKAFAGRTNARAIVSRLKNKGHSIETAPRDSTDSGWRLATKPA